MYGFKPRHAQGKPVQNLAGGGIVHSLTGMLGMRKRTPEELRAADAKSQARNQEAATAAAGRAQAAPEPAAKAAPAKAISDYSGMLAMQRREKEQGLADGGLVNPLAGVGEYWSNSNAEFEAQNPNLLQRGVRAINPVTGFGSAVGAMHDGASAGSTRDMAIAALQAVPVFGAMRAVAPAVKTVAGAAPAVLVPSMAKTAARVAKGAAAGGVADEAQAQGFANGGIVKPRGFKAGGMIRGPGTGTSDSIETEKKPGTFIMPADSTQAIGPEALEELGEVDDSAVEEQGEKMPVRLSNGEFELPPEQVQALGEAVLTVMRNATHQPASGQEAPTNKGFTPHQFFADGGRVRPRGFVVGPGTETSDSIPARLSAGEYVLPADTVKAVGVDQLDALREATHKPVKGEGAKAARGFFAGGTPGGVDEEKRKNSFGDAAAVARDASVTQVGGLANNGGADASRFAQVPAPIGTQPGRTPEPAAQPAAPAPTAASTQSAGQPLDAQAASDRAKLGAAWDTVKDVNDSAGRAIADVAMLAPRAVVGAYDSAVVRPMRAAGFNAGYLSPILVPNGVDPSSMTPYADQKRMQEQAGAVAPSAPAATSSAAAAASTAGAGRGGVNQPLAKPSAPAPSAPQPEAKTGNEIMPGVFKHGRGQYSDQSTGMNMPNGFTGQPNAQNMAAADALAGRSQQESMNRVQARGFAPSGGPGSGPVEPGSFTGGYSGVIGSASTYGNMRGRSPEQRLRDAEVSASSIMNRPQRGGRGAENSASMLEYRAALAQDANIRQNQAASELEAMRQNAGITRTGMQEQGSNTRDAGRNALTAEELGLRREAQGFQTRAAAQQEQLRNTLIDPKSTPEQRAVAQRVLSGKTAADRMQTVALPDTTNEMGQVVRGGQALVRVLEDGSVQQVPIGAQQGAALPPGMKRQIGTSNGRPVYEDMNGKQVIAKG